MLKNICPLIPRNPQKRILLIDTIDLTFEVGKENGIPEIPREQRLQSVFNQLLAFPV
jgi:hypothetical protein